MAFLDTAPRKGDSDNNLLFKIAQELSNRNGGAFPPMLGDSDNNLLYKIAQLIILGGGTASQLAQIVLLQAQLAACQAIVCPQDMQWDWTPTSSSFGQMLGYGTTSNGTFPGITTLIFRGTTLNGLSWNSKANLTSLIFQNLSSLPSSTFSITLNSVLATLSFPALVSTAGTITISDNLLLSSLSFPLLATVTGSLTLSGGNDALLTISLPSLLTVGGNLSPGNLNLITFSAPLLTSVTSAMSLGTSPDLTTVNLNSLVTAGSMTFSNNPVLTSLSFPALTSAGTLFTCATSIALTSLSMPVVVTAGSGVSGFSTNGCTSLTTLTLTNYLPSNTRPQNFGTCALTQASVDHVLARCVANAAYVSGTVTLNGGTNSTPSAAGLVDKAILVGRGVTVLNN